MTIRWKPVERAKGYIVRIARIGNAATFKKRIVIKDGQTLTTTVDGIRNGRRYQVRVAAYRMRKGKRVRGRYRTVKRYGNYYGFKAESAKSKFKRVFGQEGTFNTGESYYTSESQASANMSIIKVRVWDYEKHPLGKAVTYADVDAGKLGKKVTYTLMLRVNKALAPTIEQVFKTIYEGSEQSPVNITEAYCYSYRASTGTARLSEHAYGTAVDINYGYNPMVSGRSMIVGTYAYNPALYPYSIKRNGDIEKAFKRYGFSRGVWGSTRDYMHFSYFGT